MILGKVLNPQLWPRKLERVSPAVFEAVRTSLTRSALRLVARVKGEKLSGQVLNVRTGRLRRSITAAFEETATQFIARVGTNVGYGVKWEYGWDGQADVKAHTRKVTKVFGRTLREAVVANVRSHQRHVIMKPRPFLHPSLDELRDSFAEDLRKRVLKAVQEAS